MRRSDVHTVAEGTHDFAKNDGTALGALSITDSGLRYEPKRACLFGKYRAGLVIAVQTENPQLFLAGAHRGRCRPLCHRLLFKGRANTIEFAPWHSRSRTNPAGRGLRCTGGGSAEFCEISQQDCDKWLVCLSILESKTMSVRWKSAGRSLGRLAASAAPSSRARSRLGRIYEVRHNLFWQERQGKQHMVTIKDFSISRFCGIKMLRRAYFLRLSSDVHQ